MKLMTLLAIAIGMLHFGLFVHAQSPFYLMVAMTALCVGYAGFKLTKNAA